MRCWCWSSRAHVADFDALTELVTAGRFKAAIDVYPVEPCPKDHPIRQAGDNVVLQAHRAGSVRESLWEIGSMVVDDLEAILRGHPAAADADRAAGARVPVLGSWVPRRAWRRAGSSG